MGRSSRLPSPSSRVRIMRAGYGSSGHSLPRHSSPSKKKSHLPSTQPPASLFPFDDAAPLPFDDAAPLPFDDASALRFDDAAPLPFDAAAAAATLLLASVGMKISSSSSLSSTHNIGVRKASNIYASVGYVSFFFCHLACSLTSSFSISL